MTNTTYQIIGDDLQAVIVTLPPEQSLRAEVGSMLFLENDITMSTSVQGGLLKGLKRMVTGENLFVTSYTNTSTTTARQAAFAASYPGKLLVLDLAASNGNLLCQKDSFVCADHSIDVDIAFTKRLGAGIFGGEGFILQKLSGTGQACIHIGGTLLERDLAAGETLRVDTGCLAAFVPTVTYDIQFVGGVKNSLFGGEGLFYANLTGPGKVYLQTLPFARIADHINKAGSSKGGGTVKRGAGIIGDVLMGD